MATSPDQMKAMLASSGGQPEMPPPLGGGSSPAAAPMLTSQAPEGLREAAKVDVMLATKVLERALPAFGFDTKEGKAILNALRSFGSVFGQSQSTAEQLMPAELQQLMQSMSAGPGGGPPAAPPAPTASPMPPAGAMPPAGP